MNHTSKIVTVIELFEALSSRSFARLWSSTYKEPESGHQTHPPPALEIAGFVHLPLILPYNINRCI